MRLTVFGASGGTGTQLVRQALAAGHEVTAVVRDPARLPVRHAALTVLTAEVTDPDALRPALEGAEAVFSALAASRRRGDIASTAVRSILRALPEAGTRRLVVVSAVPVGPTPAAEPLLGKVLLVPLVRRVFRDAYADLGRMEEELRRSEAEWTIVRPPRLLDRPHTGRYRQRIGGNVPGGHTLSRADLAHAMLALAAEPAAVRAEVGVSY
ncbi:NAD(P)-dependent oxidoreductase [Amycolatopsis aidingensis]|uniref:NAD(P)-dependent oxidoreductase n=1 Tax=Amycolatopsis aidingensis TaxID=2842453 RepID=UPI001C0CDDF6|nr:NAD(P)H-binding protein [Amycolatopsis aidingensis]